MKKTIPDYPNLILISGAGRNTGKTTFACSLIEKFSKDHDLYALKFSPHFHDSFDEDQIIERTDNFIITEERSITKKDSSLMLQAGAKKVYYIQTKQENISEAFNTVCPLIRNRPIICESGGLYEFINPGIFFFLIKGKHIPDNKLPVLNFNPLILNIFESDKNIIDRIRYQNNKIFLED